MKIESMPVAAGKAAPSAEIATAAPPRLLRVLYVDDVADDRALVLHALAPSRRFEVEAVDSYPAFAAALDRGGFDVVLTDYHLVGHDARDVLRRVAECAPGLPVVVVTATAGEEQAVATLNAGAADYVIKSPSHLRRLPAALSAAVRHRTLVQQTQRTQERLRDVQRLAALKSACTEALVHAASEDELYACTCRALVEVGGYRAAWIALTPAVPVARPRLVASAGLAEGESWRLAGEAAVAAHAALAGATLAHGADSGYDGLSDEAVCPVDANNAIVALPLADGEHVLGVLTIYGQRASDFDAEHTAVLGELVADVSYGVTNLRSQAARRSAEEARRRLEQRLTAILGNIDNVVWSVDRLGLLYLSPVAERVFGRPAADFFRDRWLWRRIAHRADRAQLRTLLQRRGGKAHCRAEYRIVLPDGTPRWIDCRVQHVYDDAGRWQRTDGVAADITARREQETRITFLANHDALTGLPNRHQLAERFAQAAALARRRGGEMAVMVLDLDRFKDVNDGYGHPVGDQLLKVAAERLAGALRASDTVARLGGDEFIVLLADASADEGAAAAAERIRIALEPPAHLGEREFRVVASIGLAVYPSDGEDLDALLKNADTAMYHVKSTGGDGIAFYTHEMSRRAVERVEIEQALRVGLERGEFALHWQPKIELGSGRIVGVEALVRWQRGDGMVSPARFIPVAEHTGFIVPLGQWILREACRQARAWQAFGLPQIPVAVNISARQFHREDFVPLVRSALAGAGLEPRWLELELTESLAMLGGTNFVRRLKALKALGVALAMDDFGTGYSSLSYLKRFPIDRLKIDQSFVRELPHDAQDAAISCTIIALAHSLGLRVTAEGVETAAQRSFLEANGCDEIQGYLVGKPMPAAQFAAILARQNSRTDDAQAAAPVADRGADARPSIGANAASQAAPRLRARR